MDPARRLYDHFRRLRDDEEGGVAGELVDILLLLVLILVLAYVIPKIPDIQSTIDDMKTGWGNFWKGPADWWNSIWGTPEETVDPTPEADAFFYAIAPLKLYQYFPFVSDGDSYVAYVASLKSSEIGALGRTKSVEVFRSDDWAKFAVLQSRERGDYYFADSLDYVAFSPNISALLWNEVGWTVTSSDGQLSILTYGLNPEGDWKSKGFVTLTMAINVEYYSGYDEMPFAESLSSMGENESRYYFIGTSPYNITCSREGADYTAVGQYGVAVAGVGGKVADAFDAGSGSIDAGAWSLSVEHVAGRTYEMHLSPKAKSGGSL